jgi:hypothetical protein
VITAATGSWSAALEIAAIMNIIAAVMAVAVLRPVRLRDIERTRRQETIATPVPAS